MSFGKKFRVHALWAADDLSVLHRDRGHNRSSKGARRMRPFIRFARNAEVDIDSVLHSDLPSRAALAHRPGEQQPWIKTNDVSVFKVLAALAQNPRTAAVKTPYETAYPVGSTGFPSNRRTRKPFPMKVGRWQVTSIARLSRNARRYWMVRHAGTVRVSRPPLRGTLGAVRP